MIEPIQRQRISLDGTWEFQIDPAARLTAEELAPDRTIVVPGAWQAQHEDLRRYEGVAWYRRVLDLGDWEPGPPQRAILHFGAVDYACQVWVNGHPAGGHTGGYTPIELLIGHLLRQGRNTIAVRVEDYSYRHLELNRWPDQVSAPPASDLLHGKQGWYLDVSGIWGQAWLDLAADLNVAGIYVTPNVRDGTARARVVVRGAVSGGSNPPAETSPRNPPAVLSISVGERGGVPLVTRELELDASEVEVDLPIPGARCWEPDDPFLYEISATILREGRPVDGLRTRFGMREITTRDGRLWLNGRPLYLRAALDQDFYPETIYTPPSAEYLRAQFRLAREMGLNCLRVHIKPPDPRYLDLCDELGLLVWAELPSWRTIWLKDRPDWRGPLPAELREQVEQTFGELVARDYNHPSVVIWTLVNEDWGTQLIFSSDDREWLGNFYERARAIDPTRLIVDNSPCYTAHGPNFHVQTDLDDFHIYAAMPERYRGLARWLHDFALRPAWTFSPFGEARRRGDEPLLVSEFGTWGLPTLDALRKQWPGGKEPWWWQTGAWWGTLGGEVSHPGGVEERLAASGLTAIWPDYDSFARATQRHEGRALKAQIELIRREPAIQGYVVTEFSDIYWEANGLLDFYRQPKAFHDSLTLYNGPDALIPCWERVSYWGGERLDLPLILSHWSGRASQGSRLRWSIPELGLEGGWPVPAVEVGETRRVGIVRTELPDLPSGRQLRLDLRLERGDGELIARSFHELVLLPGATRDPRVDVALAVNDPAYFDLDVRWGQNFDSFPPAELAGEAGPSHTETEVFSDATTTGGDVVERQQVGFAESLPRLGYRTRSRPEEAGLVVATRLDRRILQYVREGGTLLYFPRDGSPLLPVQGRGGLRDGNWVSAFHWLRPDLPLSVPVDNPLGFAFADVLPHGVILGHGGQMSRDVLAGVVTGWAHVPAATICQFRYGRGRVVMSTWNLRPYAGHDPVATALLHDLIAYTSLNACRPEMAL